MATLVPSGMHKQKLKLGVTVQMYNFKCPHVWNTNCETTLQLALSLKHTHAILISTNYK